MRIEFRMTETFGILCCFALFFIMGWGVGTQSVTTPQVEKLEQRIQFKLESRIDDLSKEIREIKIHTQNFWTEEAIYE